jgi:UDP-N-acetylglucosamine 2-epimerase (non-hydrolysing)
MSFEISKYRVYLKERPREPHKLAFVFGTRTEFLKMGPVIKEIRKYPRYFNSTVISTGQDKKMLEGISSLFGLKNIDYKLKVKEWVPAPLALAIKVQSKLDKILTEVEPEMVVVQGDSTTSFAAAIAAHYHQPRIPVAHIEAGLRIYGAFHPNLREFNRRVIANAAIIHFAPTLLAKSNLVREGIPLKNIYVTGNPIIDTVNMDKIKNQPCDLNKLRLPTGKKIVLIVLRQLETFEVQHASHVFHDINDMAVKYDKEACFVCLRYPHTFEKVNTYFEKGAVKIINALNLPYPEFVALMKRSHLIITDSGSIQEEICYLGKPTLVLREKTERMEAIAAGCGKLVSPGKPGILRDEIESMLCNKAEYRKMAKQIPVYGNGAAAKFILWGLMHHFGYASHRPVKPKMINGMQVPVFTVTPDFATGGVLNFNKSIKEASEWLTASGIQKEDGSFHAFYNPKRKRYIYVYPESTGYGITTLLYLNRLGPGQLFVDNAKKAGDWLIHQVLQNIKAKGKIKGKGAWTRKFLDKEDAEVYSHNSDIFSFDNGIILNALVNLYHETQQPKYLRNAKEIARLLLYMQSGGLFNALCDPQSGSLSNDIRGYWATVRGHQHVKLALGFLNLYGVLKDSEIKEDKELASQCKNVAIQVCRRALEDQKKDGRFISFEKKTDAHPHLYAAEGLLFAGLFLKKEGESNYSKKFITGAIKAIKWLLDYQLHGGRFGFYDGKEFKRYERTDVLAQSLRLGLLAVHNKLLDRSYLKDLEILAYHLQSIYQDQTKESKQHGGFHFQYGSEPGDVREEDVNSWCTMFAIQALHMLQQVKQGKPIDMDLFI